MCYYLSHNKNVHTISLNSKHHVRSVLALVESQSGDIWSLIHTQEFCGLVRRRQQFVDHPLITDAQEITDEIITSLHLILLAFVIIHGIPDALDVVVFNVL